MTDPQNDSSKEIKRKEQLKAEQEEINAKDKARKIAYLARENKIAEVQDARETQRTEARAKEAINDAAKEKARKETYLAQEKVIADANEARKSKERK
jgi:hypothetical protein